MHAALLALALVACGGSAGGGRMRPLEPPAFVNGGSCRPAGLANLPARAGCVTQVTGDGTLGAYTFSVYARLGSGERPRSWAMQLATETGAIDAPLAAGNDFSYPRAIGAADADGDGDDDWFVKWFDLAGHGTAWQELALVVLHAGELRVVTSQGERLRLRVGGTSRQGEGVRCEGSDLVVMRAEAQDPQNTTWKLSHRPYRLDGARAMPLGVERGRLSTGDYNDPKLRSYYHLACGGLVYIP